MNDCVLPHVGPRGELATGLTSLSWNRPPKLTGGRIYKIVFTALRRKILADTAAEQLVSSGFDVHLYATTLSDASRTNHKYQAAQKPQPKPR